MRVHTSIHEGEYHRAVVLTTAEWEAIGGDTDALTSYLADSLAGLGAIRDGSVDPDVASRTWAATGHLTEAATGIRDALVRGWSGSVGALAEVMGVSARSTAQSRREVLLRREPSDAEGWATGHRPAGVGSLCQHCSRTATHVLTAADWQPMRLCPTHAHAQLGAAISQGASHVALDRIPTDGDTTDR